MWERRLDEVLLLVATEKDENPPVEVEVAPLGAIRFKGDECVAIL